MLVALEQHVVDVGLEVIKAGNEGGEFSPKAKTQVKDMMQMEAADVYVEKLMRVYSQFRDVVEKAFNSNSHFVAAFDKVCPPSSFFLLLPPFFLSFLSLFSLPPSSSFLLLALLLSLRGEADESLFAVSGCRGEDL
jgi:hypothetical protein